MGLAVKFKYLILISAFALALASASANVRTSAKNELAGLKDVKKRLAESKSKIGRLNISIKKIEESLGKSNERYLTVAAEKKRIQRILLGAKEQLGQNESLLEKKLKKAKTILKSLVLKRIQHQQKPADMLAGKIMIRSLSKKISGINSDLEVIKGLKKQILSMEKRFGEYVDVEGNLRNILYGLEENKRVKSEKYYEEIRNRKYLKSKYDKIRYEIKKKKKKAFSKSAKNAKNSRFLPPLFSRNVRYKNKGKGVYFGYKGKQKVFAPESGRIVYAGDLSTYGKLIMIDHGKGLRSVVLGKFVSRVSKGQKVAKRDIIGVTAPDYGGASELYYEIRKGNKVQLTSRLIDKKFLK